MDCAPEELNLRHLRAVSSVTACGGVNRAAERIGLSQPALTQGIAKLEGQIGAQLFERSSGGMAPTEAGRLLAARIDAAIGRLRWGFRTARGAPGLGEHGETLVTMTQIAGLLALARAGSFVSAAERTGLSQPSLHRAVRDFERVCGISMVERRGRGVQLTEAGRIIARGCRLCLSEIEAGLAEIAALLGRRSGRIAIGAMPLARSSLIPRAVTRFRAEHPSVIFDIVDGPHHELIEALRDGDLDVLVGALRSPAPGKDVHQEPLFDDRLAVVARAGHPLAGTRPDFVAMATFPWVIARPGTPINANWQRLFRAAGARPPQAPIYCGSVNAIGALLADSDCLTLLSPHQVRRDVERRQLTILAGPIEETDRPIGLTSRADWRPTETQRQFIDLLRGLAREVEIQENQ